MWQLIPPTLAQRGDEVTDAATLGLGCAVWQGHNVMPISGRAGAAPAFEPQEAYPPARCRVEGWRGGLGAACPFAGPFGRRCLTSHTLLRFHASAHRTGRADFPHPALGEGSRSRPRDAGGPLIGVVAGRSLRFGV